MKKILFLATGGTISCGETEHGLAPQLTSQELLALVPQVGQMCTVEARQLFNLDSTNMTPAHWSAVAEEIRDSYDSFDGFVVSHGTDTLGYAAAALFCMMKSLDKPVILTGGQYPITLPNSDSVQNLEDAFLCAASGKIIGVAVVFCNRIISGECARKIHTTKLDAFRSIGREEIGCVYGSLKREVVITHPTERPRCEPQFLCGMDTSVFALKLIPGMSSDVLDLLKDSFRAVIIEGFGIGGLPNYGGHEFEQAIKRLVDSGVHVIVTTQVPEGGSDYSVYEVGRSVMGRLPLIECKGHTPEYAAMRAMWALANAKNAEQFKELFLTD